VLGRRLRGRFAVAVLPCSLLSSDASLRGRWGLATRITGAQALTMAMKLCVAVLFGGKLKFANSAFLGASVNLVHTIFVQIHFATLTRTRYFYNN
jgi:hypothetical protein